MNKRGIGSGFDVGTRPHGLSVDLLVQHQKTCTAESPDFLEDGFDFRFSEEQRSHLAFAVLCQLQGLEDGKEANEPEVQAAIRSLEEVQLILKQGRTL